MPTFLILAYDQSELLRRLVQHLAPYPVLVHIDLKSDIEGFRSALDGMPHARLLPEEDRVLIRWGGFSMVRAMQNLADAAVQITDPADHLVFLSGNDYPLQPASEFANYLRDAPFRQHIRVFDMCSADAHNVSHIERRHYFDLAIFPRAARRTLLSSCNRVSRIIVTFAMHWRKAPEPPVGLRPAKGSQWFAVTAQCMTDLRAISGRDIDRWFTYNFAPDEFYFQTLLSATPYLLQTRAGRLEEFADYERDRLANYHLIHPSLVKWYSDSDWSEISASSAWFIRKVRLPEAADLLDRLDERLRCQTAVYIDGDE